MIYKTKTYLDVISNLVSNMHCEAVRVLKDTEEQNDYILGVNRVLRERKRNYLEFRNMLEEILEVIEEMEEEIEKS